MDPNGISSDFDVLLSDGSTAHVRDIRPADADGLRRFHASLSTQSIVMRFFGPHPVLTDKEVERFTNVDCVDRVALVVERGGHMVAVARYDRSQGSDEAEVAFVVQDEFQGPRARHDPARAPGERRAPPRHTPLRRRYALGEQQDARGVPRRRLRP